MNVKELFTDDDAVSPVIGVILMVAITVILAAVIGAFVLNIGGSQESAPQVTWDWTDDDADDAVDLKHGGGDKVKNPGQLSLSLTSDSVGSVAGSFSFPTNAGDVAEDVVTGNDDDTGTVQLIWESSDGSDSQILNTHDYEL